VNLFPTTFMHNVRIEIVPGMPGCETDFPVAFQVALLALGEPIAPSTARWLVDMGLWKGRNVVELSSWQMIQVGQQVDAIRGEIECANW